MKPAPEQLTEIKSEASKWAKELLSDRRTVILDTETTGLLNKDPDTEVVQLSIIDTQSKPLFSMLIKPNKPMGEEVIAIHKISNEQVMNQPVFTQVAKMISFVLKGKNLVAYNADFDLKLLWHLYKKYDQELPSIASAHCCMDKYAEWKGDWNDKKNGFRWNKLPNLSGMPAHDAYSDCVSTLKVMEMMAGEFDPSKVEADEIALDF